MMDAACHGVDLRSQLIIAFRVNGRRFVVFELRQGFDGLFVRLKSNVRDYNKQEKPSVDKKISDKYKLTL